MINTDISIYVPVYNEKKPQKLHQFYFKTNLKTKNILVVDDCSNDKTLQILKEYEDKITIYSNLKIRGFFLSQFGN